MQSPSQSFIKKTDRISGTHSAISSSNGNGSIAAPALSREQRKQLLKLMLDAQMGDEAEQTLKRRGVGHFQMSGNGHEALAGVALAMKPEDWFHPHYRDRAIVFGRGVGHEQFMLDFFAKRDSASGGRQMPTHFNNRRLRIVSLSSPVASQLLQAVGMAWSLKDRGLPEVVLTSIGDAATREGEALEAIAEAAVENLPVVFLIEDNRYGISTPTEGKTFWTTPKSLVKEADGTEWFMGCRVEHVDGLDPEAVFAASYVALERARQGGGPTCLIARLERLCSHSSSDDQRLYRPEKELEAIKCKDPVVLYEQRCIKEGVLTTQEVEGLKSGIQAAIDSAIEVARAAPDPDPATVRNSAFGPLPEDLPTNELARPALLPKRGGGLTMAQSICMVMEQEMRRNPRVSLFGEDIEDPKGDVFGISKGLSTKFPQQVRNSPLAEATIIGTAVGRAILGDMPVAAIQFVDFMGPGLNQLLNEVITMNWRSLGSWNCPMVVLAPYGAYLPGLGPWHSQTNEAVYAHMPGLHVVIPSNPADAAGLMRFALRCQRPVLYLYPKALLHGVDETVAAPSLECIVPFGKARIVRPGRDVTLVTWGNCVAVAKTAAQRAATEGIETEILDLRTITPWDREAVLESVQRTGRLLVVHEDAKTCGLAGDVIAEVTAVAFEKLLAPPLRITKTDDHNPYQYALELSILPSVEGVLEGLRGLSHQRHSHAPRTASSAHLPAIPMSPSGTSIMPANGMAPLPHPTTLAAERQPASSPQQVQPRAKIGKVAIRVPKQSPTDEDATVVKFHVNVGDKVDVGTLVAEMEANKGSYELESTHSGKVIELCAQPGERVHVQAPILYIEAPGAAGDEPVDAEISPGGPHLKEVRLTLAQLQVGALALKSQLEIPTVHVETEADITHLARVREQLKQKNPGVKLPTYTHCILWALVQTMKEAKHEGFRGHMDPQGDKLLVAPHASVGFAAVGPKDDLYSPVIKDASRLSFPLLVSRAQELTESVRTGSIHSSDLQGATVTLTNIGAFEATGGTPFVIPGQVAMLCAGSLLERPRYIKAADGTSKIEPRSVLNLKLVFDHRPFNGSHAAGFLREIKHLLENLDLEQVLKG